MKYIMLEKPMGKDGSMVVKIPIVFSKMLTHSVVAEAILNSEEGAGCKVVSAGEVDVITGSTHGFSSSLKLSARSEDSSIININDYQAIMDAAEDA